MPITSRGTLSVDLLIVNARILTQDSARPRASSVVVHGGVILAVDPDPALLSPARIIDAEGMIVTPGFNDAHAHSVWFGLGLIETDLSNITSLDELYETIHAAASSLAEDEWVIASGFSPLLTGAQPDRDRLDRASGRRPVWIKHASGHAYTVNGAALALLEGLSEPIVGGVIEHDRSGRPTGLLEETAMELVQKVMLPYPLATIERALDLATTHYVSEGITSVTDAGIAGGWIGHSPREIAAYQGARDAGILSTRMQFMVSIDALQPLVGHQDDPLARGLGGGIRSGLGDEWLSVGPVKIFSDGSLLGSTAYMTEGYVGCPHNHGYLQMSEEDLLSSALEAYGGGWALAIHAIGDRAVDHAINIIERAQQLYGRAALPNRIEHGGVVRPDQLGRIADAHIAVVPQPHFITRFGDGMASLLGPERTGWSYPAKSLLLRGAVLPASSDRPVSYGRPLNVMQSFVERITPDGVVYGADERITAAEALAAYTVGSAAATGWAERKGAVRAGMLADLVFLSDDPSGVLPGEIAGIEVVATVVGGAVVWGSERLRAR
ncbi:amidohydrolase [Lysinibacter sp. HNR]|uniref:amidohydrolase n=1 Tax=Lysinibacter sp. HNR TaxID=3031408 RepID=UPI0024356F5B|nr:amidohydrolase [Lysinibacter sp. HNR]WGD37299.1 amidohydrolase [Lysinibacter sp. HNR]